MRAAARKIGSLYDEALAPFDINVAQYSLLRKIQRLQPVSLTRLGHDADLDRSTVSRNVRVLEKAGLAATAKGELDQREAMVSLTPFGAQTLDEALPAWEASQQAMETRLGAEKLKLLEEIFRVL